MAWRHDLLEETKREVLMGLAATGSVLLGVITWVSPGEDADPAVVALDVGIGLAFAVDWVLRIAASRRPFRYALTHAYEVVVFVPYTLVPWVTGGAVLRGARLVRVLRVLRVARAARLAFAVTRLRYLRRVIEKAQLVALFAVGAAVLAVAGALLFFSEASVNPSADTYGEALFWALSVFTTTAYAAPEPVTPTGFAVTSALMFGGVAYFGVFTASLASALLREPAPDSEEDEV